MLKRMGGWSFICTTFFARRLLGWVDQRVGSIPTDRSALNVYYLKPSLSQSNAYQNRCNRVVDRLEQSVDKSKVIVYPLSRKAFLSHLWQTSAKLLYLVEDNVLYTSSPEIIDQELNLVTQFIVDGGRVIVLLDPSPKYALANQTSFGAVLSNSDSYESQLPITDKLNNFAWRWTVRSLTLHSDPDSSNDHSSLVRILVGSWCNSSETSPRFAVLLMDCVEQYPHLLSEAITLLDIPCNNVVNGHHTTLPVTNSTDPIPLYCLNCRTIQKLPSEVIQSGLDSTYKKDDIVYEVVPIHANNPSLPAGFAWLEYLHTLKTRVLGRTLVWTESLPSSYGLGERLLPSLPPNSGLMIISNRQTEGKGRGTNRWITPVGQASFTFHMTLRKPPEMQHASLPFMNFVTCMQHVVALAIVLAGRRILAGRLGLASGDEPDPEWLAALKLPGPTLLVKWPNDVYVVQVATQTTATHVDSSSYTILGKMAGLLTKCTLLGSDQVDCLVGVGINVQNKTPSICLQQVLESVQPSADAVSTVEMMAQVLNQTERVINAVLTPSSARGLDWLIGLYTQCWMHENQRILVDTPSIGTDGTPRECVIVGLDEFGYLRVRDIHNAAEYSLHPDGNSMDMMRGLICAKR